MKMYPQEWENIKNWLDNSDEEFKGKVKKSLHEVKDLLRKTVAENALRSAKDQSSGRRGPSASVAISSQA